MQCAIISLKHHLIQLLKMMNLFVGLKNVVFWGYGISYGIPYFHMLLPKCTYP